MQTFMENYDSWLTPKRRKRLVDAALLLLRVGVGGTMLLAHGRGKLGMLFAEGEIQFADPIGLGPALSLALTVGAEFVCAGLLVVGLATRAAALPLAITMLVAIFVVHGGDPFAKQELALLYLLPVLALLLTGGGRWSLDDWLKRRAS